MPAANTTIQLAHGGGGRLSQQLIEELLVPAFGPADGVLHDAAILASPGQKLAFTTDSYVVRPLFFPGGNIGELAVYGSVNDLAMAGAMPVALSLGLILEEGLEMATLHQVIQAIRRAAERCTVKVITGDTKVVERGKGDGLFINTSAIGVVQHELRIHPSAVQPGDAVVVSGDLGRHGTAMCLRTPFAQVCTPPPVFAARPSRVLVLCGCVRARSCVPAGRTVQFRASHRRCACRRRTSHGWTAKLLCGWRATSAAGTRAR